VAVATLFAQTDFIYGILPAHAFPSTDLSRTAWTEHPFGSGPFRVVQRRRADEIALEPNPYAQRKPHLRRLILKIVPDRNTAILLLRTHAVDVLDYITDFQSMQLRATPELRLVRTDNNAIALIGF
jgi:peptide/nickel transport system substrate-binding protein